MKAMIVEDNPGAMNVLKSFLKEYPGNIELCGTAESLEAAKKLIQEKAPEIWLLDIRLHDKLVFSLLQELGQTVTGRAAIIFLTAYDESNYVKEALKVSALDFIVKPVDREQFFASLDKAKEHLSKSDLLSRISRLEDIIKKLDTRVVHDRIAIHRVNGEIDYENKQDIIYIITEDNVSRLILKGDRSIATTKLLKYYEDMLIEDRAFLRVSKQVILNLKYLKSFNPKTNLATLTDGTPINVSRRKSSDLLEVISGKI